MDHPDPDSYLGIVATFAFLWGRFLLHSVHLLTQRPHPRQQAPLGEVVSQRSDRRRQAAPQGSPRASNPRRVRTRILARQVSNGNDQAIAYKLDVISREAWLEIKHRSF